MRRQPIVVAWGGGRDSTAIIIEFIRLGIQIDAILIADVGSEKDETYVFIRYFIAYCKEMGVTVPTIVKYVPKKAPYTTIEGNMCMNCTLPGEAFGFGSCTVKWKIKPQDQWCNRNAVCNDAWLNGMKVIKVIGYECGEEKRAKKVSQHAESSKQYEFFYPLIEWGWDLERCIYEIDKAGVVVPPKSACYFCPNMKPHEIDVLTSEERGRIIRMEVYAEPFNQKIYGLWRKPNKKRDLPGSMTEYILREDLEWVWPEDSMGLNPKCWKARRGYMMRPPHIEVSLREMLASVGFEVPAQEQLEDDLHGQIVMEL